MAVMVKVHQVKYESLTVRIGWAFCSLTEHPHSISVLGQTGQHPIKYHDWYAKVTGFKLGKAFRVGTEVEIPEAEEPFVEILWFHEAKDPLSMLPKTLKDPDLSMLRKVLDKDHYLLGTVPATISMHTIQGTISAWACGTGLIDLPAIVTAVNVSGLYPALLTGAFILYHWTYTPEYGHSINETERARTACREVVHG
ncbi:hypothetical protein BDM02DRAFT_3132371 [Thelephora ganbajun]|uniref:Uncharacterized protein n=1 Tax=Thelephora ganbajun TaxID=370292 RepID=A0ACB6Z1B5_THEGA|nr:hypothetical protein BDM02DRAFT_3132371 [Thelephora ganbajun]